MESRQQNVSEDGRAISPRVTRSISFLDGRENSLPIPYDVMIEIFLRMPSKSIARCRCVSRLWGSILRRQDFTELFLTKSRARPQLIFACEDHCEFLNNETEDIKFFFFSSPQPQDPDENSPVLATKYHLAHFPTYSHFVAHTDGFFCCRQIICNPTTGQFLTLPRLSSRRRAGDSYLGYEPIAKEFKVLSMTWSHLSDDLLSEEHKVLTLGTKDMSWRMVECCIPHFSSHKWICISGVLYYIAAAQKSSADSMVVCFDLKSEKFSVVETLDRALPDSTIPINYNGKLGLLMSKDSSYVSRTSTSFELWVLGLDAGRHQWSTHIYVLPPLWVNSVAEALRIVGMVGTSDIVLSPWHQNVPSYVIYYNVERKTITQVGIQGMEAIHGKRFNTFLNYVENVKLI